jgi:hypothetical protein
MNRTVTIVSGLPRSGTSMMMAMLAAGGIPVVTDHIRRPDEHNPRGYFELEAVKHTATDPSWLVGASGKAVKMVYLLLYDLPPGQCYRVVFMRRNLDEVLASQETMLRAGRAPAQRLTFEQVRGTFELHLRRVRAWLNTQPNFAMLEVDYEQVLSDTGSVAIDLDAFLGPGLDVAAMAGVPDDTLYRHRAERRSLDMPHRHVARLSDAQSAGTQSVVSANVDSR